MKHVKLFLGALIVFNSACGADTIDVAARCTKKMGIVLVGVGDETPELRTLCQTVAKDLMFTGQFEVRLYYVSVMHSKKQVLDHQQEGGLLLALEEKPDAVEWRLYSTRTAQPLQCHKINKRGTCASAWAHGLTDQLMNVLTGKKSSFASKLVYCKELPGRRGKTQLCIANIDGTDEQILAQLNTVAIAPRWSSQAENPVILYSEYTPTNVRLMTIDLHGKKKVATSFDGLNMLPAFSPDGKQAVLCLSVEGASHIYRYRYNERIKRGEYVRLTHNKGTNLSPAILNNGDIVFCSDFETGQPHIYLMDGQGKKVRRISDSGGCTSPAYCPANNMIIYSKLIDGISQLMIYDLQTATARQLTTDRAHKEEASWSPCGHYVAFSVNDRRDKRLAVENLLTGQRSFITGADAHYSYPAWSGSGYRFS